MPYTSSIVGIGLWLLTPLYLASLGFAVGGRSFGHLHGSFIGRGLAVIPIVGGLVLIATGAQALLRARRAGHLATDGAYAWCRNPLYAGHLLGILPGLALALDGRVLLLPPLIGVLAFPWAIRSEERALAACFGEAWTTYASRVNRLLPGWPRQALLMFLCALAAAGESWSPVGLSGGGAMFGPAISPLDPDRMLVHCDMGGAYRSEDGGRTWILIHADQLQGNTTCRPAFHPNQRATAYSASGWEGRLKVTRDGGRIWTALGELGGQAWGGILVDAQTADLLLVGVDEAVALSRDGGRTWTRCVGPTGRAIGFAAEPPATDRGRTYYAATQRGVWRSDDGGTTWTGKNVGLPGRDLRGFAGGFSGQVSRLYCTVPCTVIDGVLQGGIHVSADRGEHWTSAMKAGLNRETKAFDQWAMGPVVQYHQVLTTDRDPFRAFAINANTGIPPPHHCAVYRSDDGGASWRSTFFPDPRWPGFNLEHDYTIAGVGQYYQAVPNGVAICAGDPDRLLLVDDGNCLMTRDGGARWSNGHTRLAGPGVDPKSRRIPGAAFVNTGLVVTSTWNYYLDPHDRRRHYICYTDIGLGRSLDGGRTWRWWGDGERPPWVNTCYELAFDPAIPGRVWGAFSSVHDIPNDNIILGRHRSEGPGGIAVSADAGEGWAVANQGLPLAPTLAVVVDPASPARRRVLYAGVFGHGVFRSEDDGRTWRPTAAIGSAQNRRVARVQLHGDGTLFALVTALKQGEGFVDEGPGLYRSPDRGASWTLINRGTRLRWPKDFALDPKDSRRILLAAADACDRSGGLYATNDGGARWQLLVRKGPQHFSAAFSPHHPGWIYATLCEGAPGPALWLSKDGGGTWQPFAALPFRNAQRLAFDPTDRSAMYLTTFGASVLRGPAEE